MSQTHYLENASTFIPINQSNGMADPAPPSFTTESADGKTVKVLTFGGQTHLHRMVCELLRGLDPSSEWPEPETVVAYCSFVLEEIDKKLAVDLPAAAPAD